MAVKREHRPLIDASDERLLAWLAELPPRQELVVRMALNGRGKNHGPYARRGRQRSRYPTPRNWHR